MGMPLPAEKPALTELVPRAITSNALSTFRTRHEFSHFASFRTTDEFLAYRHWAKARSLPLFVLGKGSNVLFCRRRIDAVVLLNKLPRQVSPLGNDRFYISSSASIGEVLRVCRQQSRDSFYYLASVPASIGGALAMNAGRGQQFNQTIYDFVESVTLLSDDGQVTIPRADVAIAYRWTQFLDRPDVLLLGATFRFPLAELAGDPVAERIRYCKDVQDPVAPNCGSAFSHCDMRIMGRLRGLRLLGASYSAKTNNWILNRSDNSRGIVALLMLARLCHWLSRQACRVEYIRIR